MKGTGVEEQLKDLQKQSGLSSQFRERRDKQQPSENLLQLQQGSFFILPYRESDDDLKKPYEDIFNQICKPKNWEGVANTCLTLVD